jgi:dihydroorotate dehydrogenase electron transfer subunit
MFQNKVQILWNRKITPLYYKIGLRCGRELADADPGQFIMLRFVDQIVPFLRRPFSIHRLIQTDDRTEGIELLYKVVGECTRKMTFLRPGDAVDVIGPLGKGFGIPDRLQRVFIAAGGIGVAPLLFLAFSLRKKNVDPSGCRVFLGGKTKTDLLCGDDFRSLGMPVHQTTDDGSEGDRCFVTHPLEAAVRKDPPEIIYACGPPDMLKCVAGIAEKFKVSCQISVESRMACGIGACLGCAVRQKGASEKYFHTCLDGPVFDAASLEL